MAKFVVCGLLVTTLCAMSYADYNVNHNDSTGPSFSISGSGPMPAMYQPDNPAVRMLNQMPFPKFNRGNSNVNSNSNVNINNSGAPRPQYNNGYPARVQPNAAPDSPVSQSNTLNRSPSKARIVRIQNPDGTVREVDVDEHNRARDRAMQGSRTVSLNVNQTGNTTSVNLNDNGTAGVHPSSLPPAIDSWSDEFIRARLLESIHFCNAYRSRYSLEPLQFDKEMTHYAQNWVNYLALNNLVKHNPRIQNFGELLYTQENLDNIVQNAVTSFFSELGALGNMPITEEILKNNFPKIQSFVQLMWKPARYIGIGISQYKSGQYALVFIFSPSVPFTLENLLSNIPTVTPEDRLEAINGYEHCNYRRIHGGLRDES